MKFCKCGTLLNNSTITGKLVYHCPACNDPYTSTDEDTLVYRTGTQNNKYKTNESLIRNAPHVSFMPKVDEQCPECKNKTVVYDRVPESQQRLFICSCGHYWTK